MVTVEKPIEPANKTTAIASASDKPAQPTQPVESSINVYSEANHQGVMVYSQ